MKKWTLMFSWLAPLLLPAQQSSYVISSPDGRIAATVKISSGHLGYSVNYNGTPVLLESHLGLVTDADDFYSGLVLTGASPVRKVNERYELFTGKRTMNQYTANSRTVNVQNARGKKMNIIFQVSNDGLAFRYHLPQQPVNTMRILEERSSFRMDTAARAFVQPMQVAKTGWEQTNPAYEEHYRQDIPVTDTASFGAGWIYPALFRHKNTWLLISESAVDSNYCGTRLVQKDTDGEYHIGFPDPREVISADGLLPRSSKPLYSPWRVIAIGSLKTLVESTLGTDVATPALTMDTKWIKPGKASWSWIMSKDDSIVYSEQVRYIDFASRMNWQYCLVDVNWDRKIGYEKMKELAAYAASKKVGLILWYNSAGNWNTVRYTPKSKLLTHEDRVKEFSRLADMGIKGLKIDFFGGDGQSVMGYYHDILRDAAAAKLMVNFHGASLPRGWQRTYPNLVTVEAVKGFEFITFTQADADKAANHCAMLPFTRNVFDPMDFTPMNLHRIPTRVKRKTTSAFELATSVLFLSGVQHLAESPAGMEQVPPFVQDFLRKLPERWDEVSFLDGYPGRFVVIARKRGNTWYIAGINGENSARTIDLDLSSFKKTKGKMITDGTGWGSFVESQIQSSKKQQVTFQPNGGFVIVLE